MTTSDTTYTLTAIYDELNFTDTEIPPIDVAYDSGVVLTYEN